MKKWFSQQSPVTRLILLMSGLSLAGFLGSGVGTVAAVGVALALATETSMGTIYPKALTTTAGYLLTIMVISAAGLAVSGAISVAGLAVSGTISVLRNNDPGDGSDNGGETA